jgi:NAD+ synthase (glutamine-hydrolysing)
MPVTIACCQLNQTVGDFSGNLDRIERCARDAAAAGAQVLLTPELSLSGYPPEDLLFRTAFYAKAEEALGRAAAISGQYPELHLVVGYPLRRGGVSHNAAGVLKGGQLVGEYLKHELPNYSVFDEVRYFRPGDQPLVFTVGDFRFGVVICEDFWLPAAPAMARAAGADVLLALNASPYHLNKRATRFDVARDNVCGAGMPFVACNLVGGQDELVFDGQTFALGSDGNLVAQALEFAEDLLFVDVEQGPQGVTLAGRIEPDLTFLAQVYEALKMGVRDYVGKNGFPGVLLGLSGGVDSALTLAVAVDALGADRVRAVMMPSDYTAGFHWKMRARWRRG